MKFSFNRNVTVSLRESKRSTYTVAFVRNVLKEGLIDNILSPYKGKQQVRGYFPARISLYLFISIFSSYTKTTLDAATAEWYSPKFLSTRLRRQVRVLVLPRGILLAIRIYWGELLLRGSHRRMVLRAFWWNARDVEWVLWKKLKERNEPWCQSWKRQRQAANVERELWEGSKGRSMSLTWVVNEVTGRKRGFDGGQWMEWREEA